VLYITLLDQFHPGIYSSQVIDVCDHLNKKHNVKIRVLAFLSIKELIYTDAKKRLKQLSPTAIVLPAFPKLRYFQLTAILLFFVCLFTGERIAICRNIFCTVMALKIKKLKLLRKVVLDGRSSMAAEIEEYNVFPIEYIKNNIRKFEAKAVLNSDFRMAVSHQLIDYWKTNYGYSQNKHIVIPCTLDTKYFNNFNKTIEENKLISIKKELGINENDIVLVYSGSTAPWQSFQLLEKIICPIMDNQNEIKILFLSKKNEDNLRLKNKYKDRVIIKWLEHKDVLNYLNICDYGILIREQSITNKVASPTKFAEYLYAGLPVLISTNLGDFSEFVQQHNCGVVWDERNPLYSELQKTDLKTRDRCNSISLNYFTKNSKQNSDAYTSIVSSLQLVS
jgi:glycosyltransferase involved in cell wall biosynthesis